AGKVEFRNDSGGNVHAVVGKLSFAGPKLSENIRTFIDCVVNLKPAAVKGQYLKGIAVTATMSPSVRIQPA
ncbi:MAG: 50S ribosomal protein L1, partial [Planctomycetota bacterium]